MASIKQTINQESHFDLRIVDIASDGSKPGVLSKTTSDLNSRYFPADQISASQHRLCLTGGHLEKMKVRKALGLVKQKKGKLKGFIIL